MAVFELDACLPRVLGGEAHLDFAGLVRVGLELPRRADVPAEHHARPRLVDEDPSPAALAAVDAAVIEVPSCSRLEHRLGNVDAEQVVLAWLETAEVLREH